MRNVPGADSSAHTRGDTIRVCIDARPLFSEHRQRGIGTYVSTLSAQVEYLQEHDEALGDICFTYLQPVWREPALRGFIWRSLAALNERDNEATAQLGMRLKHASRVSSLDEIGCDIYHATSLDGISISQAYKTVVTLHDLIPLRMGSWLTQGRHPLRRLAYLYHLRQVVRASHVIAVSQATKRDACALLGIPEERVSVIPPALDPARGHVPRDEEMAATRDALHLREPYFVAVASSDRHKNVARIVEAFAAFRANTAAAAEYRLYLVGTWQGREARRVLDLVCRLGLGDVTVRLPWVSVEHLPALYHGATALVFPSLIEGFGLPVLEAMASATAVITSNCSSLPEVAGEAALYVNPVDSGDIARALARIASDLDLREQLKARGLERGARFHPRTLGRELLSVYRQVACDRSVDGAGAGERVTSPQ